jgi:hypothetical protein
MNKNTFNDSFESIVNYISHKRYNPISLKLIDRKIKSHPWIQIYQIDLEK